MEGYAANAMRRQEQLVVKSTRAYSTPYVFMDKHHGIDVDIIPESSLIFYNMQELCDKHHDYHNNLLPRTKLVLETLEYEITCCFEEVMRPHWTIPYCVSLRYYDSYARALGHRVPPQGLMRANDRLIGIPLMLDKCGVLFKELAGVASSSWIRFVGILYNGTKIVQGERQEVAERFIKTSTRNGSFQTHSKKMRSLRSQIHPLFYLDTTKRHQNRPRGKSRGGRMVHQNKYKERKLPNTFQVDEILETQTPSTLLLGYHKETNIHTTCEDPWNIDSFIDKKKTSQEAR
ncbi:hypothetical protein RND71_036823 [Anisodus tanguticus]|uniref:Uncharacterized protein n=1 Tax=Anisodus tanguticus TaxID=243964 RepID=A0AAE1R2X0_9SOLA|nr:hypothetical protein RND71_036823 [Anisodus tanguticus]